MSEVFDSIMTGLNEALDDSRGKGKKLSRRNVTMIPLRTFSPGEIKKIRLDTGMSQTVFAWYLGVSAKTVEAWEAGTNRPSGAASRILSMIEKDKDLVTRFPFVRNAAF